MNIYIIYAFVAGLLTWFITALGSATVLFIGKNNQKAIDVLMSFSAGVMLSASFWSLLLPAKERAEQNAALPPGLVITLGFAAGAVFILTCDKLLNLQSKKKSGTQRVKMLVLSITLHNFPEGISIGVAFGALFQNFSNAALAAAISLTVGIALQNFPEGAAVSLPMRMAGYSKKKALMWGQASALVEPIGAAVGAAVVGLASLILPFALSFAAGAMLIVAVCELVPESKQSGGKLTSAGLTFGFCVMMLLDVIL